MRILGCLIGIVAVILLQSCNDKRAFSENETQENDTLSSFCLVDRVADSMIYISDIADSVLYFKLDRPSASKEAFQVFYDEKQIVLYDMDNLFFYSLEGVEKNKVCCPFASVDYDIKNQKLHVYEFRKRQISVFSNEGNLINTIRLRTAEEGDFGQYFASIDDSTYVLAKINVSGDDGGLLFVSSTGKVVGRMKSQETFTPSPDSYTYHSTWDYPIIRTDEGIGYYPSYGDSIYWLDGKGNMEPFFAETVLKKIPLENRTEVSGGVLNEVIAQCRKNKWATPRYFVNSRFVLAQYVYGRSNNDLPKYLLYDRKGKQARLFENRFSDTLFHFGIYNDYDGGLAFTPLNQSGNYLIMAGAGNAQGGMNAYPKTLYTNGRKLGDTVHPVVSGKAKDAEAQKRLSEFFSSFEEDKQTMITILRLKQ